MSCSLKVFRRYIVDNIVFRRKYDFCFFPILVSFNKRIKITEVPVKHNFRQHGQSKYKTIPVVLGTVYDYFMLVLRMKLRRKKSS
jgi:hypothetical protein